CTVEGIFMTVHSQTTPATGTDSRRYDRTLCPFVDGRQLGNYRKMVIGHRQHCRRKAIHSRTVECELYASAQLRCMRQECNRESNQEWSEGRARCLAFCPTRRSKNLPASIRQRLLNLEQEHNDEFALIPTKYGLERMLFRLSLWCIADSHP